MSAWERVNCAAFAAIVAALLLFAGHQPQAATATPAAPAPVAAEQVVSEPVAVESVSVDSESEASGIHGMTVGELMRDAWTSQQAVIPAPPAMPEPLVAMPEYVASYAGTPPAFPAGYYSISSLEHPGVLHVFQVVIGHEA